MQLSELLEYKIHYQQLDIDLKKLEYSTLNPVLYSSIEWQSQTSIVDSNQ